MDIMSLPLKNHFVLITDYGFSTFMLSDPHSFTVQDIPLRFVSNVCISDPTDQQLVKEYDRFFDQFRYKAIKFFGTPMLVGLQTKQIFKQYEKPLQEMLDRYSYEEYCSIVDLIKQHIGLNVDCSLTVLKSPLFVFTRNGMPDM